MTIGDGLSSLGESLVAIVVIWILAQLFFGRE